MPGVDAVLTVDEHGLYDIQIGDDGDIVTEDFFDTAILVSLFTDARADASEVADAERRGGWIGNESTPGIQMGSKLWLYESSRLTRTTLNGVEDAARDSLMWLVDEGYALSIRTEAEASGSSINLGILIERRRGQTEARHFELWENTGVN